MGLKKVPKEWKISGDMYFANLNVRTHSILDKINQIFVWFYSNYLKLNCIFRKKGTTLVYM